MEELITKVANYVALSAEAVAVLLIVSGIVVSLWTYASRTWFVKRDFKTFVESRNHPGRSPSPLASSSS